MQTKAQTTSILFEQRFPSGEMFKLGNAVRSERGWRFIPNVSGRKPSTKFHATWEACLPRWIGYPDGCESRIVK